MFIWDLNLRLFHWILMILIVLSIISGKQNNLFLHQFFGSMSLGLIFFRIFWGFYGPFYAKFKTFISTPKEIYFYLRGFKTDYKGHNPIGSLSVFSFYFVILILGFSGLFSSDDIFFDGPLANLTPNHTKYWNGIHNNLHYLIYFLIFIHLISIGYYQFIKKEKLINQMIDGKPRDKNFKNKTYKTHKILIGLVLLFLSLIIPPFLIILI
tara:strand:+ start:378 stop:1007 length:630 start_codon:yes stop_codon:yes gene_type:complete